MNKHRRINEKSINRYIVVLRVGSYITCDENVKGQC